MVMHLHVTFKLNAYAVAAGSTATTIFVNKSNFVICTFRCKEHTCTCTQGVKRNEQIVLATDTSGIILVSFVPVFLSFRNSSFWYENYLTHLSDHNTHSRTRFLIFDIEIKYRKLTAKYSDTSLLFLLMMVMMICSTLYHKQSISSVFSKSSSSLLSLSCRRRRFAIFLFLLLLLFDCRS